MKCRAKRRAVVVVVESEGGKELASGCVDEK